MSEPAEFLTRERAEKELTPCLGRPGYAYRDVAKCLRQLVKTEQVNGGTLITPFEYEDPNAEPQRRGPR